MNVIRPLPIMKLTVDKSLMTYFMNWGQPQELVSTIWYIDGPKEKIIVDTGASAETIASHGWETEQISTPEDALAKVGLKPEDIDIVIMTQLHLDHVEYAGLFTNARIIVQQKEYDFAMTPHALMAPLYVKEMYENLPNLEFIDGDKDIAEGVSVIFTPGHTPGTQSVVVKTDAGTVVISGQCTVMENFYPPEEMGAKVITPGIHTNATQAYDSAMKVKELADIVVPLHGIEFCGREVIPG